MLKRLIIFNTSNYINVNNDFYNGTYDDLFDEIRLYNENNLDEYISNKIIDTMNKYGNRGYGYYIWKPYLLLKELKQMNDGDVLIHFDVHCRLSKIKDKIDKLVYARLTDDNPIISGYVGFSDIEYTTTKLIKCVENNLDYRFTDDELRDYQRESGILFIKKNYKSLKIIQYWQDIMLNNIDLVTDSHNKDKDNPECFKENRHDQSVLSLILKFYKMKIYKELDFWMFNEVIL